MNLQETFNLALQHHSAGQLAQAETLYREILAQQPTNADVITLLGVVAHQSGRHDVAIDLIRSAVKIAPTNPRCHQHLGLAYDGAGRIDEAIASYNRAIELNPNSAEALSNLGQVLGKSGRNNEAIVACRKAISLNPNLAEAHNNLGSALAAVGKTDEAIVHFRTVIRLNPRHAGAFNNLGLALCREGQPQDALAACQQALSLKPNYVDALNNLGIALRLCGRVDDAISLYNKVLLTDPNHPDTLNNLGNAFLAKSDFAKAEQYFRSAIDRKPDYDSAQWNLGLLLLLNGDYERGLPLYEHRRKVLGMAGTSNLPKPEWDGSPLNGKRILIHAEQGFGDVLQCARYLPLIAERGGKIILAVPAELTRLMQSVKSVEQLITLTDLLPGYDVHCPIMTLPLVFKTTLQTIPTTVPYLQSDPELKRQWQARIPTDARMKIGLTWLGRRKPDPNRSVPPADLAPLTTLKNVWFCSLQKPAAPPPPGMEIADFSNEVRDFADTAALMESLDLIITIDTSIAHLAGALGRPTWALIKDVPDWRWLLNRDDSPWYPTMRLFRQPAPFDWRTPINQIVAELARRDVK